MHIEIVLNVYTFILQYIFSGWGNEMSPDKNLHHFCFSHQPSFDLYIVILSPGTNEIFLPDRLKKNPIQLAIPQTNSENRILAKISEFTVRKKHFRNTHPLPDSGDFYRLLIRDLCKNGLR